MRRLRRPILRCLELSTMHYRVNLRTQVSRHCISKYSMQLASMRSIETANVRGIPLIVAACISNSESSVRMLLDYNVNVTDTIVYATTPRICTLLIRAGKVSGGPSFLLTCVNDTSGDSVRVLLSMGHLPACQSRQTRALINRMHPDRINIVSLLWLFQEQRRFCFNSF